MYTVSYSIELERTFVMLPLALISTIEEAMETTPPDDVNEPRTPVNLLDMTSEDDHSDVSTPPSDILDLTEEEQVAAPDDLSAAVSTRLLDWTQEEHAALASPNFLRQSTLASTYG